VNLLPNYRIFYKSNMAVDRHLALLISDFQGNLRTRVILFMCVSNFGRSIPEIQPFFEIQYGDRQPSWIPSNAKFEVTLRRAVIVWLCA
jgi:hypothetical protein